MNALIIGGKGTGKSTLINWVFDHLGRPATGFETKKELPLSPAGTAFPVYIYEIGNARIRSPENLLGYCANRHILINCEGFDRYAQQLLLPVQENCIIKMDELGTMECQSETFCRAVLTRLSGNIPVIAAVKNKHNAFLQQIRAHENCKCFYITRENRNSLREEVLSFMKAELEKMS